MVEILTVENLVGLVTLTALEIVLGIDNIVFIAVITGRLDPSVQPKARRMGLSVAMGMRILLLLTINWIMHLTRPLFEAFGHVVTGRDIILLAGGLFLLGKATYEIHEGLEGTSEKPSHSKAAASFNSAIFQIMLLDVVFSLDSVITAVGMARHLAIMIAAIVAAVLIMLLFAGPVSDFIHRHTTIKMLALAFLLLIGVMLVLEGLGKEVEKGYIYFAMAFSLGVEMLNIKIRRVERKAKARPGRSRPLKLEPKENVESRAKPKRRRR
jgi:predicted tellurium resistance membrane protein TerC